jgi:hypothetical protein
MISDVLTSAVGAVVLWLILGGRSGDTATKKLALGGAALGAVAAFILLRIF